MPSASGLRQMFPRHTIKIFMGAKIEESHKDQGLGTGVQSCFSYLFICALCLVPSSFFSYGFPSYGHLNPKYSHDGQGYFTLTFCLPDWEVLSALNSKFF